MQEKLAALLRSDDPDERKMGIQQLIASKHPNTLKILHKLHETETDPEIKRMIRFHVQAAQSAKRDLGVSVDTNPNLGRKSIFEQIEAQTQLDFEDADHILESARHSLIAGNRHEAWELARQAFELNPDYAFDPYAVGLAAEITGADEHMAAEVLLKVVPQKAKMKQQAWEPLKSPLRVIFTLGLIGLGYFSVTFVALIFTSMDHVTAFQYGIESIVYMIVPIVIFLGAIHFFATRVQKRVGHFNNLIIRVEKILFFELGARVALSFLVTDSLVRFEFLYGNYWNFISQSDISTYLYMLILLCLAVLLIFQIKNNYQLTIADATAPLFLTVAVVVVIGAIWFVAMLGFALLIVGSLG